MAEAIVGPLLEDVTKKLAIYAQDKVTSLWGVNKDLKDLANKMSMIQAMLREAENKHHPEALRNWLGELKNVAYDVEDLLDECF